MVVLRVLRLGIVHHLHNISIITGAQDTRGLTVERSPTMNNEINQPVTNVLHLNSN